VVYPYLATSLAARLQLEAKDSTMTANPFTRREFLSAAAVAAASTAIARAATPNETVQVAVLGCGRGAALARQFAQLPGSRVAAICDVDATRRDQLCEKIESLTGKRPEGVADFRRLLDRKDIDALAIATPDHWHAPATILACLAGKDVYVEKPASHNIIEGRTAVRAARKYGRIVQHGTQLRSFPHYREAWDLLRKGTIGKVLMVKAINNQRRRRVEPQPDGPVPAGVDYDLWLGPGKKQAFNRNRFHGTWHWTWEYGTGDIGNDGIHQIDIGRWALGLKAPNAVSCSAAKLGSRGDAQETPDAMVVTWEYDDLLFVFEQRDFTPYRMPGHRIDNDNIFYGTEGFLMIDRNGYRVFHKKDKPGPAFESKSPEPATHYENFVTCIKTRHSDELIADIEEGHLSALLCHLGNISYRTGRRLIFDSESETFPNQPEANALLGREYRAGFELPKV
jgi:predicted dehydrogenase